MSRVEAVLGVAALLLAGCFMSLDESRWKTADSRPPARDLARDAAQGTDAPRDQPSVDRGRTEGPAADIGVDAKQADGPQPDTRKLDGPKPDAKKLDAPKPDAKKLDAPKPDAKKPDLSKPPDQPGSCVSMALTLQAAPDDGELWPPDYFPDGESGHEINLGHDEGDPKWGYFRFTLAQAIPAGATITSATLSLWGAGTSQWGMMSKALELRAEQSVDAPTVTGVGNAPGTGNPQARPVTTALVRWPASGGLSWSNSQYNTTPSLAPLLQEVVTAKGGLAWGSHVQLWVKGAQSSDGSVITPDFQAASYAGHPAKLDILFCK